MLLLYKITMTRISSQEKQEVQGVGFYQYPEHMEEVEGHQLLGDLPPARLEVFAPVQLEGVPKALEEAVLPLQAGEVHKVQAEVHTTEEHLTVQEGGPPPETF